ncbi:MAG: hypothetical protein AAF518_04480 [Spirochaetota bacterium]
MKKFCILLLAAVLLFSTISCNNKDSNDDLTRNLFILFALQQIDESNRANAIAQHPGCSSPITASNFRQNIDTDSIVKATLTTSEKLVIYGFNMPSEFGKSTWGRVYSGDPCTTGIFSDVSSNFTVTVDEVNFQSLTLTPSAAGTYTFEYTYSSSSLEQAIIE